MTWLEDDAAWDDERKLCPGVCETSRHRPDDFARCGPFWTRGGGSGKSKVKCASHVHGCSTSTDHSWNGQAADRRWDRHTIQTPVNIRRVAANQGCSDCPGRSGLPLVRYPVRSDPL